MASQIEIQLEDGRLVVKTAVLEPVTSESFVNAWKATEAMVFQRAFNLTRQEAETLANMAPRVTQVQMGVAK